MFELGFFGTRAPLFMDVVTVYFALVPFLVAISIFLAVIKKLKLHLQTQLLIFSLTLIMVAVFEIGVRLDGGFNTYMRESVLSYNGVLAYLIVHILFALVTMVAWGITIYSAIKAYRAEGLQAPHFKEHRKNTRWIFLAIIINSAMGTSLYPILFIF